MSVASSGVLAKVETIAESSFPPTFALLLRQWESNDEYEQFNHGDCDHQGCKCYRIVIEPMTPLYIH
jgi:hypothetical protein